MLQLTVIVSTAVEDNKNDSNSSTSESVPYNVMYLQPQNVSIPYSTPYSKSNAFLMIRTLESHSFASVLSLAMFFLSSLRENSGSFTSTSTFTALRTTFTSRAKWMRLIWQMMTCEYQATDAVSSPLPPILSGKKAYLPWPRQSKAARELGILERGLNLDIPASVAYPFDILQSEPLWQ